MKKPTRVLRKPEVLGKIGLSDTTLWRLERKGIFPRRIQLGPNSVGWIETEIDAWLDSKANAREVQ